MSKYSHYEMCEKIFGQRYKWNEQKQDYELYSRTDMWNKLIEQQDKIADLEAKLAEHNEYFRNFSCENFNEFQDFISTFMLTPHEEQTLIKELKQKLAEKERRYETLYKLFSEQHEIIDQNELECFEEVNRLLKEQKDFYVVEKVEYDKMKQGAKDIVDQLKQQLQDLPNKIVEEIKEEGDFSDFGCMGKLRNGYYSISADDLDTILKKFGGENE